MNAQVAQGIDRREPAPGAAKSEKSHRSAMVAQLLQGHVKSGHVKRGRQIKLVTTESISTRGRPGARIPHPHGAVGATSGEYASGRMPRAGKRVGALKQIRAHRSIGRIAKQYVPARGRSSDRQDATVRAESQQARLGDWHPRKFLSFDPGAQFPSAGIEQVHRAVYTVDVSSECQQPAIR
jgi:hypothetical protein